MGARRYIWPTVVCTTLCVLIARPVYADPAAPVGVPDPGVQPIASTPLTPSTGTGGGTSPLSTVTKDKGPFAAQLFSLRSQLEALGEQITRLGLDAAAAHQSTLSTYQAWRDAADRATRLQAQADSAASNAYKQATELGPWGDYANDLQQLGQLAPGLKDHDGGSDNSTQTLVQDAAKAAALERAAYTAYTTAQSTEQRLATSYTSLAAQHAQARKDLDDLIARNAQAVLLADLAQQAADNQLASHFNPGTKVNGYTASPVAIAAVNAALSKLGKPYVWGAEGPDYFDCSGLVLWSYRQAGFFGLPRVAADQFHATRQVAPSELLPGDLLFFSTTSRTDWTSISHVGIYYHDNLMIEAPSSGDVVKVAPIWWSAFFGATRVVGAIPPAPPPPPAPAPSPTPKPTPSPTPSPSPSTSPSPTPTPSGSQSPTPSPTPSRTPSPTPSPTPSSSNTPSPNTPKPSGSTPAPAAGTTGPARPVGSTSASTTATPGAPPDPNPGG
jgi:cell wall-associated NlpC family hydrolase